MDTYVIDREGDRIVSFLLSEGGNAIEIRLDPAEREVAVGDIYVGKVKNIAGKLNAAFVEILPGQICYLPGDQVRCPVWVQKSGREELTAGDELAVQVLREGIKTKAPALTTVLTFTGRYTVLYGEPRQPGVSKKISGPGRKMLRELAEELSDARCSCVIRTGAAEVEPDLIRADYARIKAQFDAVAAAAVHRTVHSCLYRREASWLSRLKGVPADQIGKITAEDPEIAELTYQYLQEVRPDLAERFVRYKDPMLQMRKLYSLERELERALSPHVWLKSGASLVIEPTEALVSIDVNTGKQDYGKKAADREQAFLKTNLEAARECARQIRLRNLSGIILVDFINMADPESDKILMREMRKALMEDPVPCSVIDMTALKLVEITRKKIEKPLYESAKTIQKIDERNS